MRFVVVFVAIVSVGLLASREASAKPEFPEYLQDATDAPCMPQCNICHESTNGGGEADQPFVKSLVNAGEIEDADSMKAAVAQVKQQNIDSDGDGVGDIDEVSQGKDPNYGGDALICLPKAGCGAHIARDIPDDGWETLLALATLLALSAMRRRR